jgi:hypothetical protein
MIHGNERHVIMSEYGEVCRVPHYMHAAGATDKIIKAVNSHSALVAALEKVALFGENPTALAIGHTAALMELGRNARAALAKAQGEGGAE